MAEKSRGLCRGGEGGGAGKAAVTEAGGKAGRHLQLTFPNFNYFSSRFIILFSFFAFSFRVLFYFHYFFVVLFLAPASCVFYFYIFN